MAMTFTTLAAQSYLIQSDFNQTWTILAAQSTLIQSDFNQTWTILQGIDNKAFTINSKVDVLDACSPIPITASTTISISKECCLGASVIGISYLLTTGTAGRSSQKNLKIFSDRGNIEVVILTDSTAFTSSIFAGENLLLNTLICHHTSII